MPATRPRRRLDERLAKALAHPLRQQILEHLTDRVASPNELARALEEPLGNVSYHVRILRDLDCVELVRTEQRRGAVEHYYRGLVRPWLSDEQWARLPANVRRQALAHTLTEIWTDASTASKQGGFDHPQVHVSRAPLDLDEQGWDEVTQLLATLLDDVMRVQAESLTRQAGSDGDASAPVRSELAMLHFLRAEDGAPARKKK